MADNKHSPAVVEIDARAVGLVSPLPQQVRQRWDSWQADGNSVVVRREVSLDEIQSRLQAAEAKRAEIQAWVMSKARRGGKRKELSDNTEQRAQRIEEKLAIAEAKRQSSLDAVRLKASASLNRMHEAENRLAERQAQLAQRIEDSLAAADVRRAARQEAELARLMAAHAQVLDRLAQAQEKQDLQRSALNQRLEQADGVRESHLASIAANAAQNVARVREVAILMRERAAADSEDRRVALQERLDRATQQRAESVAAMAAAQPSMRSTERFLQRQAYIISGLRRKVSSRKVQRYWRTFAQKRRTTRALAIQFVGTGVTSLQLPASDEDDSEEALGGTEQATPRPQPGNAAPPAMAVMGVRTGLVDASGEVQSEAPKDAFETFAEAMQAPATLRAAQALLRRLETRAAMRHATGLSDISGMLRRLFPKTARSGQPLERYPPRVFLCAFMILNHPRVVFNTRGEREEILAVAAKEMISVFEALLAMLLEPGSSSAAVTRPSSARATPESSPQPSPASSPARPAHTLLQPAPVGHSRPPSGLTPRNLQSSFSFERAPAAQGGAVPMGIGAAVAAADAGRGVAPLSSSDSLSAGGLSFMALLTRFDQTWVSYLEQFVAWKFADVASLQTSLVLPIVPFSLLHFSAVMGTFWPPGAWEIITLLSHMQMHIFASKGRSDTYFLTMTCGLVMAE
ncbi:hypothetical protein WJX84_009082 [Apatococcus fuscideae]|uniref:Uncharacterized protein n=1 Tax=Apatococcus fuscideae TaxID=2026836 RepID=A0AAW1SRF4_9CHLO